MTRSQRIMARIIFWIYIAVVLFLCFGKFGNLHGVPRAIWGIPTDKVVHFLMFFPFPILAFLAYDVFTDNLWKSLLFCLATFLFGVLIAAGTEYGQSFLPHRSGDRHDLQADVLALSISAFIVLVIDILKQLVKPRKHA